jgi:hypothetical protein
MRKIDRVMIKQTNKYIPPLKEGYFLNK